MQPWWSCEVSQQLTLVFQQYGVSFFSFKKLEFHQKCCAKGVRDSYTSVLSGWKQVALNWVKHYGNLEVLIPILLCNLRLSPTRLLQTTLPRLKCQGFWTSHCIVFLDKELHSLFSLPSVLWVSARYTVQGATERWISILSRKGVDGKTLSCLV